MKTVTRANYRRTRFDVRQFERDMASRGWIATDLARAADVSDMTVSRFLRRLRQNPQTAKKLADAIGHPVTRYIAGTPEHEKAARS